jgi:hypothetical protein
MMCCLHHRKKYTDEVHWKRIPPADASPSARLQLPNFFKEVGREDEYFKGITVDTFTVTTYVEKKNENVCEDGNVCGMSCLACVAHGCSTQTTTPPSSVN